MNWLKTTPLHPWFFTLFPILTLYAANKQQVRLQDLVVPALFFLVTATIMVIALSRVTGSRNRGAVLTSAVMILFFSYREIHFRTRDVAVGSALLGTDSNIVAACAVIVIVIFAGVRRRRTDFPVLTPYLNITAVILLLTTLFGTVQYELARNRSIDGSPLLNQTIGAKSDQLIGRADNLKRDIYYIILDTYAREDTLKNVFSYDNRAFTEWLEEKGFFVASKSSSNYTFTQLSLASSLNMTHITDLEETHGRSKDPTIPYELIRRNKLSRFFRNLGYRYVHFSTGWGPTARSASADVDYAYLPGVLDEFNRVLLESSVAAPIIRKYAKTHARNRTLYNLGKLKEVPAIDGPTFTFAHLTVPHQPFVFDRHGRPIAIGRFEMGGEVWKFKKPYLDQLIYTTELMKSVITEIIEASKEPPIIVVQSDHGPSSTTGWADPSDTLLNERMNILNAYYLPEGGKDTLYNEITPVNSFRVILNHYFKTGLRLESDKSFFSTKVTPYKFTDVTDRLE